MSATRTMRKLNQRIVKHLQLPSTDDRLIDAIGKALNEIRERTVLLRAIPFPPNLPSGLWVDQTHQDLIAYEATATLEHQLVIIGHEVWHMFSGHCGSATPQGPAAQRALDSHSADALREVMRVISDIDANGAPSVAHMDASLHVALRSSRDGAHQEVEAEAEFFGLQFATAVNSAVTEARTTADPTNLVGRIQASMAHRFRRP